VIDTGDEINSTQKSFKIMKMETSARLKRAKPNKENMRGFNSEAVKLRAALTATDI
jgi:F0F1-type ATP synthase gamma subunit